MSIHTKLHYTERFQEKIEDFLSSHRVSFLLKVPGLCARTIQRKRKSVYRETNARNSLQFHMLSIKAYDVWLVVRLFFARKE